MSGGVDSSTALALLKEAGHDVVGLTLRILPCEVAGEDGSVRTRPVEPRRQRCCSVEDIRDARETALALGAPHYVCEGLDTFRSRVVESFLDGYAAGLTPNPCVECNRHAKLPLLIRRAEALDCEALATGHYVRCDRDPVTGRWCLRTARDADKDQSYFLYRLPQALLERLAFPLGNLTKAEVRAEARRLGVPTAEKPESMEICFIPEGSYRDFVRKRRPEAFRPGPVVDREGRIVGRHGGVGNFTVGQRRGLGFSGGPWYVVALDAASATVTVARREEIGTERFTVGDVVWMAWEGLDSPRRCRVKLRSRGPFLPAEVRPEGDRVRVRLEEPAVSVTPGQSAVFYDGDAVAGGGVILKD